MHSTGNVKNGPYRVQSVVAFVCLVTLAGCGNVYEGFKTMKLEDCYQLSYPDQEECLLENDVSYDEYESERKVE